MAELLPVEVAIKKLRGFAEQVCVDQSPLYEVLSARIADDPKVFDLLRRSPLEQPGPNLFFAAVHFLLLSGASHELRQFYATYTASPKPPAESWPAFRDFCLAREQEITAILSTRRVQTNEVRRCSYLFPLFSVIHAMEPKFSLAIFEVGASGGLNLNWDRYAYDYGPQGNFGTVNSNVRIQCEISGKFPLSKPAIPNIAYRRGIDLHPVDVSVPEQARWLQALIWPDQPERFQLQQAAIDEFRRSPVPLIRGDALEVLPAEIASAPPDARLCVVHCHTLNQFSREGRKQFTEILKVASQTRSIHEISAEWIETPTTELRLTNYRDGAANDTLYARVDHHGRWAEWC